MNPVKKILGSNVDVSKDRGYDHSEPRARLKCPFCGFEWTTETLMIDVFCPSCYKRVPVRNMHSFTFNSILG